MSPRQEIKTLNVNVDKNTFNGGGEAAALENGLKRNFALHGYRLAENGHELRACIVNLSRGSRITNTIVGLGVGKDVIEIEVKLISQSNATLLSFNIIGEVIDKRYAEVREMLADELPETCRKNKTLGRLTITIRISRFTFLYRNDSEQKLQDASFNN